MADKHPEQTNRKLRRAGFVVPRVTWVRKEDALNLQRQINKAVERAAQEVERIRNATNQPTE